MVSMLAKVAGFQLRAMISLLMSKQASKVKFGHGACPAGNDGEILVVCIDWGAAAMLRLLTFCIKVILCPATFRCSLEAYWIPRAGRLIQLQHVLILLTIPKPVPIGVYEHLSGPSTVYVQLIHVRYQFTPHPVREGTLRRYSGVRNGLS